MSAQSKPHDLTELQRLTVASNACRVAEPCRKYGGGLIGTGTIGAPWGSMHLCLRTMFLCVRKRDLLLTSLSTTYQILALKEEFPSLPSLCLGCSQLPESLFLDLPPHPSTSLSFLTKFSWGWRVDLTPLTGDPLLLFFTAPGATFHVHLEE